MYIPRRNTPRTLMAAFPAHYAWRNVVTHYRRPLAERVTRAICMAVTLAGFAVIGVLLAYRG